MKYGPTDKTTTMKNTLEAILNECETLEEARAQAKMWLENKKKTLRKPDAVGSLLKSIHQDLVGFQEMGFLTPDTKSGLGIAIEQVERYMRDELQPRQQ